MARRSVASVLGAVVGSTVASVLGAVVGSHVITVRGRRGCVLAASSSAASAARVRPGWAAAWMASVTAASSATTASPGKPCSPARWTTLTSRQRFVADIGRASSMRTVSPMRASFSSSWALNWVVRRMTRLYSRWRASRSTDTTIVLSIRSLTTRPTFVFRFPRTLGVAPVIA